MLDQSDSTDEKDISSNNGSQDTPLLDKSIEKEDEMKDDTHQTSEAEDTLPNTNDDQIDINDIIISERVGWKLFAMALFGKLFFLTF